MELKSFLSGLIVGASGAFTLTHFYGNCSLSSGVSNAEKSKNMHFKEGMTLSNHNVFLSMNSKTKMLRLKDSSNAFEQNWFSDYWFVTKGFTPNPSSSQTPKPTVKTYFSFESFNELEAAVNSYCETSEDNETYGSITTWDVSQINSMTNLFYKKENCNPDIGNWNVSNVIDFSGMFSWASSFDQDISAWNVSKGENFYDMFYGTASFDQNLCPWSSNTYVSSAFHFCNGASCGDCKI